MRITAEELAAAHSEVRDAAREAGRAPEAVALTCCSPVEVTAAPVAQDQRRLRGSPAQLADALRAYARVGVALQFTVPRWPDRMAQMEAFAAEVLPGLRG